MNTKSKTHLSGAALLLTALAGTSSLQASTDYGPAIWSPPSCVKYYTSGDGHHFCVIHDMEGFYAASISYMHSCSSSVSVFYAVNGKQDASSDAPAGQITQIVREAYYAWHARCWNQWMFGTEHEGFASNPAWYTDALYNATIPLQTHLANKTAIPKDRNHIIGHNEHLNSHWRAWVYANYPFDPTCNSHTDPGPYWNWTRLMNGINGVASTPSAPSTLAATTVSTSQVKLTWKDNSGIESGFKVERATASGGPFSQIATVGANVVTYTAGSLTSGTTYWFRVRAYNGSGNSGYSNTASATTKDTIPAAPSALTATAVSETQINLAWTDNSSNEDGFRVYRSTDGTNFTQVATTGINVHAYNNTGLSGNTKYYYKVYSFNTAGNSTASNVASDTTAPLAPSALTATSAGSGATTWDKVNLSWTDNSNNEVGFKVERSPDNVTFTQIVALSAGVTTYQDSGLTAQHTYYYRVRSYNANGNSSYSNTATVTTPNAPPALTAIGNKTVAANSVLTFTATATDPNKSVVTTTWETFESYTNNTPNENVMFNRPSNSSTTSAFQDTSTNYTFVTTGFPTGHTAGKVLKVGWGFKTGQSNPWVRLNTFNTPFRPNPCIDGAQVLKFDIYSTKALKVGLGMRETGTTVAYGANGGTTGTIDWAGVTNVVSGNPIANHQIAASNWTTISLNIPFEAQAAFTGDGHINEAKGALDHLILGAVSAASGAYTVYLDNFAVVATNTLTYSIDAGAPTGVKIDAKTGMFSWTPTSAQVGNWNITVRVTDQGGAQDFETIKVTVTGTGNNPPVLGAIGNKTVNELSALTFTATATDPDAGQTLTFSLDSGNPSGSTINGSTGAFSWTPTEAQGPGSYPITVRVTDNGSPSSNDFETITVTVNEVNTAPVLVAISDQTVNEGTTLNVTASATDSDIPANTISYSLEPGAPAGMTINTSTGVISWTPAESDGPNVYPVTVKASDNGSPVLSMKQSFLITVNEVNVAPVLTLGTTMTTVIPIEDFETVDVEAQNGSVLFRPPIYAGTTSQFVDTVAPNFTEILNQTNPYPDVDVNTSAQVLHTTWGFKTGTTNPWMRLTTFSNPSFTNSYADPNPTVDFKQRVRFDVWSDRSVKVCIGVRETQTGAPIGFDGGSTGTMEWVGATSTISGGQPQCTHTVNASNWTTVEINLATDPVTAFTGNGVLDGAKGVFETLAVVPNNGTGVYNVYFDNVEVVQVSTNLTIDTLATITVTNTATDADIPANNLTFSLGTGAPTNAAIDPVTGVFTWTPLPGQSPSTNDIPIIVTDDGSPNLSDTKNLHVVVNKVNTAPRLGGIPDNVVETGSGQTVTFTATAEDDDVPADTLTFSLTSGPSGASIDPSTGVFSWTPPSGNSTNLVTVRVTDNGTPPLWEELSFQILVVPTNTAPTIALSTATVTETFANFETFTNNTPNDTVMFRKPANSSTTSAFVDGAATNYTRVTSSFPAGNANAGSKVLQAGWSFVTGTNNYWVRLDTAGAVSLPNPTIDFRQTLKFDVYTTKSLGVVVDCRESNSTAPIGGDGGTTGTIEFAGASGKQSNGCPIPTRTVTASNWTTLTFNLPTEPIQAFTGDGILAQTNGALEALALVGSGGTGAYTVYLDNFQVCYSYSLASQIKMNSGATLTFTASGSDPDPGSGLSYSLDADDPATATIDPVSGAFSWTPDATYAGTTNTLTATVQDNPTNGALPKSSSQSFTIAVVADPFGAQSVAAASSDTMTWDSVAGKSYQVQAQGADGAWSNVGAPVTATGPESSAAVTPGREYRVVEVTDAGSDQ